MAAVDHPLSLRRLSRSIQQAGRTTTTTDESCAYKRCKRSSRASACVIVPVPAKPPFIGLVCSWFRVYDSATASPPIANKSQEMSYQQHAHSGSEGAIVSSAAKAKLHRRRARASGQGHRLTLANASRSLSSVRTRGRTQALRRHPRRRRRQSHLAQECSVVEDHTRMSRTRKLLAVTEIWTNGSSVKGDIPQRR